MGRLGQRAVSAPATQPRHDAIARRCLARARDGVGSRRAVVPGTTARRLWVVDDTRGDRATEVGEMDLELSAQGYAPRRVWCQ